MLFNARKQKTRKVNPNIELDKNFLFFHNILNIKLNPNIVVDVNALIFIGEPMSAHLLGKIIN